MTKTLQSTGPTNLPQYHNSSKVAKSQHPLFNPGRIVATPGALNLLWRTGTSLHALMDRHVCGDWGEMEMEDQAANYDAVSSGARILSSFNVQGEKLWIITEAVSDATGDGRLKAQVSRTNTCYLLPEEY